MDLIIYFFLYRCVIFYIIYKLEHIFTVCLSVSSAFLYTWIGKVTKLLPPFFSLPVFLVVKHEHRWAVKRWSPIVNYLLTYGDIPTSIVELISGFFLQNLHGMAFTWVSCVIVCSMHEYDNRQYCLIFLSIQKRFWAQFSSERLSSITPYSVHDVVHTLSRFVRV